MVSVTLGLLILSGVLVVFVNTSAARNEVERTSRQIENGRYASELLTEDLRLAGFYGELNVAAVPVPGALPGDPCSLTPGDWRAWIPIHLQGYDDAGFVSPNCTLPNLRANTDVLVIRRARACAAGAPGCDAVASGKPYMQVSLCAAQVTPNYKLGLEGTETFDMQKRTCLTTALANKREYLVRIYFIANDNGAGQNIPTLKRLELTGSGWSIAPLVEGIEELQLHYGLDTNGDGMPDAYVANPNDHPSGSCSGACPRDNWLNVVTVQFHLLARNLEVSPVSPTASDTSSARTPPATISSARRATVFAGTSIAASSGSRMPPEEGHAMTFGNTSNAAPRSSSRSSCWCCLRFCREFVQHGKHEPESGRQHAAKKRGAERSPAAIESVISTPLFIANPANAVLSPCGTANTLCADVTGDGAADFTTTLVGPDYPAPPHQPTCVSVRLIKNQVELHQSRGSGLRRRAAIALAGVAGAMTGDSLCANTVWEIRARTVSSMSPAEVIVTQGVGVRVSSDQAGISC